MKKDFLQRFLNPTAYKRKMYYLNELSEHYDRWGLLGRELQPSSDKYTRINETIAYREMAFGSTKKVARKAIGKPILHFKNIKLPNHEVLLYSQDAPYGKVKSELHFLNDELFFAKNVINNPTEESIKASMDALKEKYHLNDTDSLSHQFEDVDKNKITVKNNVRFVVSYISGNSHYLVYIKDQMQSLSNQSQESQEYKELF